MQALNIDVTRYQGDSHIYGCAIWQTHSISLISIYRMKMQHWHTIIAAMARGPTWKKNVPAMACACGCVHY